MQGPTLFTADAGQAFGMISPSRIERAFRIIFLSFQFIVRTGKQDPTLSCMHTAKSKARFGGWIQDTLLDRSVFFMSKVSSCMRSLLRLRWFRFGNRYLVQVSGIPIGGPVSGAALEAVLFVDEDAFDKFGWYNFPKPSTSRESGPCVSPSFATSMMYLWPQGGSVHCVEHMNLLHLLQNRYLRPRQRW